MFRHVRTIQFWHIEYVRLHDICTCICHVIMLKKYYSNYYLPIQWYNVLVHKKWYKNIGNCTVMKVNITFLIATNKSQSGVGNSLPWQKRDKFFNFQFVTIHMYYWYLLHQTRTLNIVVKVQICCFSMTINT